MNEHWEVHHESALARAEARSLSLPKRGDIEPQVWDEQKAKEGLPCEADDGCTNNATKTFTIIFGEESHESYDTIDLCEVHSDQAVYFYRQRERL